MGELKLDNLQSNRESTGIEAVPNFNVSPPVRRSRRKYWVYLIVLSAAIALFEPVKTAISNFVQYEATDDATIAGRSSIISAKIGGIVSKVLFEDHQMVKKGDLLVQLDDREFQNTVRQLQAELSAATATFDLAKKELERGEFDNIVKRKKNELESESALLEDAKQDLDRGEFTNIVKRRKSELESGMALLAEATQTLRRVSELKKRDLISDGEYDAAKTNFENNSAKVSALKVQLKEAELSAVRAQESAVAKYRNLEGKHRATEIQIREALHSSESARNIATANYQTALAKIWSIQAQLDQAKLNLEYTNVRAIEDGVVSRRGIEPGMVIKASQPITTLLHSHDKWVTANFKETQLKNIYIGQPVEIEIDAIEGKTFEGTVQSISPGSGSVFALIPADNATGNFTKIVQRVPVKIVFKPESLAQVEKQLIPGTSVFVKARIKGR